MNARAIFDYEAEPKTRIRGCNLCYPETSFLSYVAPAPMTDRYGYLVRVWECDCCGLVMLGEQMTPEGYARFYSGPYRKLVSAYHGREINADTIQAEQRDYARDLGRLLFPYMTNGAKQLLDIGGSTGIVARHLATAFGLEAAIIDPCLEELAISQDAVVLHGSIETMARVDGPLDLIIMCQTVDHLTDIKGALAKVRAALSPHGLFFVDYLDYELVPEIKIDHPYYLTESTMMRYLERAGLKPVEPITRVSPRRNRHGYFVCRPA